MNVKIQNNINIGNHQWKICNHILVTTFSRIPTYYISHMEKISIVSLHIYLRYWFRLTFFLFSKLEVSYGFRNIMSISFLRV